MPRPGLPLTPASSTDLQAKDNARSSAFEMSFALPPPAITSTSSDGSSNSSVKSDSSYHPVSPASPVARMTSHKNWRASSNQKQDQLSSASADFSLPPPPTRSRKIIQMKPGRPATASTSPPTAKGADKKGANTSAATKKQPTSTSVAGKKIARKTAHSLIERRRRSKMNEEFGVLKDMIPACHDQEMHKLAILQASIDYLRYLEQCVSDLKTANNNLPTSAPYQSQAPTPRAMSSTTPSIADEDDNEDDNEDDRDLEMQDSVLANPSPALVPSRSRDSLYSQHSHGFPHDNHASSSTTTSPAILPSGSWPLTHNSSHTSISSLPSPADSSRSYHQGYHEVCRGVYNHRSTEGYNHSTDGSPAILPQNMQEADQEATAALLMLNMDRRHDGTRSRTSTGGRAMSVQDLLSA
ncbi:hypothetical protein MMC19_001076 [Ptychographa xylographoides]|nr:hypothetical protein [Ptychographa xylographoides]